MSAKLLFKAFGYGAENVYKQRKKQKCTAYNVKRHIVAPRNKRNKRYYKAAAANNSEIVRGFIGRKFARLNLF